MDQPTDQDYLAAGSILSNPRGIASTNTQENPDVAAQSVALSRQTGVPAPVIHADPDRFSEQLKAQSAGDIVTNNPQLQRYVSFDPMAAKVSSDDWAQLDETSQAVGKLSHPGIFQAMGQGWAEGWDYKGQQDALNEIVNAYDSPAWRAFATHVLGLGRAVFDVPAHAVSGVVQAGISGLTQAFANAGDTDLYHSIFGEMASGAPERFGRDLNVLAQTLMMEGHGLGATKEAQVGAALDHVLTIHPKHLEAAADLADKVKPFIQDGKDIPVGVHPVTDQVKAEEAKTDIDSLKEATKAAQASATRERSPEMFRDFMAQHVGEDTIGISADAALKLYGNKVPEANDGLLGFVPDMADQLLRAAITGEDVKIPKADWLTYIDPKVANDIAGDVRVRAQGLTQEEAKNLPKYEEAAPKSEPDQFLDQMSTKYGAETDMSQWTPEDLNQYNNLVDKEMAKQASNYTLREQTDTDTFNSDFKESRGEGWHLFNIMGGQGGHIGDIELNKKGATLEVHWVGKPITSEGFEYSVESRDVGTFGPSALRKLLKQLREIYPDVTKIEGERVSGARETARSDKGFLGKREKTSFELPADPVTKAVDTVRQASGLKVLDIPGPMKLSETTETTRSSIHRTFDVVDQDGNPVAGITIQKTNDPTELHVENIVAKGEGRKANQLGPQRIRQILDLLKSEFPEAKTITGRRISGARFGAAKDISMSLDQDIKPSAVGINADQAARYQKLIATQQSADHSAALARAEAFERRQQTPEWKANEKEMRGEVTTEVTQQPRFVADQAIRNGDIGKLDVDWLAAQTETIASATVEHAGKIYEGATHADALQKLEDEVGQLGDISDAALSSGFKTSQGRIVSREEALDLAKRNEQTKPEQDTPRNVKGLIAEHTNMKDLPIDTDAAFRKMYFKRGGESPDWVARILGYASGDDLIKDLAVLQQERSGMKAGDYLKHVIDSETSRRMEEKYGKLEENILQTAKEQVLTETQLDLLHAELETLASGKLNFTKDQLRQNAAEAVGNSKLSTISSDSFLASAGRAGRAAEDALLKGDPSEAFRQRQRQYASTMYAKEAMKIEKAKTGFDKLAKRFSKREVPGALQEYTNQIHDLMVRLGLGVKRSVQDIAENTARDSYSSFDDFVHQKESSFRELHVPDFLRDANFRKPLNDLTGNEFMQVAKAFKALAFNARDESKIIRAGEKADLAETINEMVEKLQSLGPPKTYRIDHPPSAVAKMLKSFGWSGIQMETMFNRFDRDDPMGVFNQTIVRIYTEAANYKDRLVKQFQDKLSDLGRIPDVNKLVRNDIFIDPITNTKFAMSKRNVLGVLANIGNESNLRKLAAGYKLTPEAIKTWVEANTTKEDWDRAQRIGEHFNELFDMANTMSHNISGVGIERLPLAPIESKFGTYKGWYNPVNYDPIRPGESKRLLGPNALEQEGFYRATTPRGYTKGRTGYIAPVELNLDIIPTRMKQMIHDITMRPAIIQLSKFFYNPDFKRAVINYYGQHQAEMMVPFLRDIANSVNFQSQSEGIFNKFLNAASQNMVGTMIGMNPSTVMKHGPTALVNSLSQVGIVPWAKEFAGLLKSGNDWSMAMEKSDELSRRMRNWQEVISNTGQELNLHDSGAKSLWKDVRSVAQYMGSYPVSASDLLSAVPTWLASYKKSIANGVDEGQAKFLADRDVRQAHGSSIQTNKPAIARSSNAMAGTISRLYGFFSHILQKQYEIAWRTKDAFGLAKEGDIAGAIKSIPKIAGMITSYVLAPALIEELVTPYTNSDHDSWGAKAAKTLGLGMSSSMIGVRDLVYGLINNRDPQGGILGGEMKAITDPIHDLASGKAFTVAKAGDFLKHAAVMVGVATGITNAQEGKSIQFIYNYFHNREHPQNLFQTLEGLRYGKTKGHSKSFDDWLKHEVP